MRKTLIFMLSALMVLAVSISFGQISKDVYDFEVGPGTASKLAQAGFKFLSIPVGARQTSLGAASMALSNDANALFWNPAGIAMSGVYFLGYSWKGTYYDDDIRIQSHYALTKARGFGIGLMRDDYAKGVKTTTLCSLAPPITDKFTLGWTGKWRGGFNFDVGVMAILGNHVSFGFVGRNVRYKPNVRRYWESGLALHAVPGKLDDPKMQDALKRVIAAGSAAGKAVGVGATNANRPEQIREFINQGARFFSLDAIGMLKSAARRIQQGIGAE